MSEKEVLPLPGTLTPHPRRSRSPKILLGTLLALATLINFHESIPGVDQARSLVSSIPWNREVGPEGLVEHDGRWLYDEAWFKSHVECPAQPAPIYPKIIWNMTHDDKRVSVERYAQSVVSDLFIGSVVGD